ncbi:MAG: hypothetical protein HWE13_08310 [Gammaproteobacteria bacterium]|nr:hypothetical protein [Gammaproteobacteria bacterium]NVK88115.1 hypothetical protein [Gammaproteobacteria bacterium]
MNMYKLISSLVLAALLSGCVVGTHHRVGHGHHHSRVSVHGHIHGGSRVAGALIAGAIIGSVITAAKDSSDQAKQQAPRSSKPQGPYYYRSKDGRCFWVTPREDGSETRELIEDRFCEE